MLKYAISVLGNWSFLPYFILMQPFFKSLTTVCHLCLDFQTRFIIFFFLLNQLTIHYLPILKRRAIFKYLNPSNRVDFKEKHIKITDHLKLIMHFTCNPSIRPAIIYIVGTSLASRKTQDLTLQDFSCKTLVARLAR